MDSNVVKIAKQIQKWTDVTLPSRNTCPYFLHPITIPNDWDWTKAYSLVKERLLVMRMGCNKKWTTVDTVVTIFLECILQACLRWMVISDDDLEAELKRKLQAKYAEFLGLPMTFGRHNHLAFAVAHRVHGRQMVTGWPRHPTSLRQRLNADATNNILIETRASNFLKYNFAEYHYPQLQDLAREMKDIPLWMADEDLDLGEADEALDLVSYLEDGLGDDEILVDDGCWEVDIREDEDCWEDEEDLVRHGEDNWGLDGGPQD